jgi:hypothetical protein
VIGHIINFPQGQFVDEYGCKIVGYCASIRLPKERALGEHQWKDLTGKVYASTHNPKGEYLYGVDVFVDPSLRKKYEGVFLYNSRKIYVKN